MGGWDKQGVAELDSGDREDARRALERILSCANDVGLFAEEIDPKTGGALANFPQAFTHVGLINTALLGQAVYAAVLGGLPQLQELLQRG